MSNKHNMPVALYQALTDAGINQDKAEKAVMETEKYISDVVVQAVQPIVNRMDAEFKVIHAEITSVRKEVATEISSVRKELATEMSSVRNELRTEVKSLNSKLNWLFILIPLMITFSTAVSVLAPHLIK